MERVGWDEYFMRVAYTVAERATCHRKHVGAVIVKDRHILATGYNGSIAGTPHCNDDNHIMEDGHCVRVNHAECNAICQAAKKGVAIEGASIYVTAFPCWPCFRMLANAGVAEIVYDEVYRNTEHGDRLFEHARAAGIHVRRLSKTETKP